MNQVIAVTKKNLREFIRDKMVLFWTFAVPLFFLIVFPLIFGVVPSGVESSLKGSLTLTMITFLVMTSGQSNLPGSIASDTERGLYLKMASMPVNPYKEGLGRVLASWVLSFMGVGFLLIVGVLYGAKFNSGFIDILLTFGFILVTFFTSVGIGLIIASFVKGESAATHTGVAVTLLTYFIGGMAVSYSNLPMSLQIFARLYPLPSANASMISLLVGVDFAGYNPLSVFQTSLTVLFSLLIFIIGLVSYSKLCWRKR